MNRRDLLTYGAAGLVAPFTAQAAYPEAPVRVLVGFSPGGPSDILTRIVAAALGKQMGQQFNVENKAGASGAIAVETVVKSPGDGQTLIVVSQVEMAITPNLRRNLPYDAAKDLTMVVALASQQNTLVVHPASGINSLQDFIARARSAPGKVTYASGGAGTPTHMLGAMLSIASGVDLLHVPYKGAGPALADLMGGHVDAMFVGVPAGVSLVRSGKLKALAVTGTARSAVLAEIPTFSEAGVKVRDFDDGVWWALAAPAGLAPANVDRLARAWVAAAGQPDTISQCEKQGFTPQTENGKTVLAWTERELGKWARVIKTAGIKAE